MAPGAGANSRIYTTGFGILTAGFAPNDAVIGAPAPGCGAVAAPSSLVTLYLANAAGGPTAGNLSPGAVTVPPTVSSADLFVAGAVGKLNNRNVGDTTWDAWSIDQNKTLLNTRSGI